MRQRAIVLCLSLLPLILFALLVPVQIPHVQAQNRVLVQCGQTYHGGQLDFTNAHKSHHEVDIVAQGNGIAKISCPGVRKSGGLAVLTNRISCDYLDQGNFALETNSSRYVDCFGGTGYLTVYITQIDLLSFNVYTTYVNYTPPGAHWFSCWGYQDLISGSNVGYINVIDVNATAGNYCPNPI